MDETVIAWVRIGNVALVIAASILIGWNTANDGHLLWTSINVMLIVANLAMLWKLRDL